jgi:hypothetical protein
VKQTHWEPPLEKEFQITLQREINGLRYNLMISNEIEYNIADQARVIPSACIHFVRQLLVFIRTH